MAKHVLLVFSNPTEGAEEDYNRWYDEVHLPEVVQTDGFVSAQRFKLDAAASAVFEAGMSDAADPVFLSLFRMDAARLAARFPGLAADRPHARLLRSVLMKPEHEGFVDHLHARLEALARAATR